MDPKRNVKLVDMKLFLCLLLFLPGIIILNAQLDTAYKTYIYDQIRQLQPKGTIYYADQPVKRLLVVHIRAIKSKIRRPFNISFPDTVFALTAKEKQYVESELRRLYNYQLPDNTFPDSKVIKSDSIISMIDKLNFHIYDSIQNLIHLKKISEKNYLRRFWSFCFTPPIFLRNRTLMIYYFMNYAVNGGQEDFDIYRQKDGKWIKWIHLAGGAW